MNRCCFSSWLSKLLTSCHLPAVGAAVLQKSRSGTNLRGFDSAGIEAVVAYFARGERDTAWRPEHSSMGRAIECQRAEQKLLPRATGPLADRLAAHRPRAHVLDCGTAGYRASGNCDPAQRRS